MFYILYIGTDYAFDELKKMLEDHLVHTVEDGEILRTSSEELVISWDWATLSIKEGGQGLRFTSEDYEMELRYSFWFEILSENADWAERLMSFTGHMLSQFKGDCVLESNGDTPILIRRNNRIVVDDKKLKGTRRFPFHALNQNFVEGDIERV
ncbi:hypothetical protein SAMN05661091_5499 [Paenibacillus uliginis N3/975]|uniref:Uncharacterized protein n=1 Tax=Paenibacillus uliginis N3/975 TaxID=1313296 RepID=A0A1X7HSB2_9BACL|nr:SitI3 family protein [Paenibacillus uliginis]SMF91579.1 hypothetical protein SAMN05661091_5499 [Paenibacillus uliginis N3/975]